MQTFASFCHVPSGSPLDCLSLYSLPYSLPYISCMVPVLGARTVTARDWMLGRSRRQPGSPLETSPTTPKSTGSAHETAGVCIQYRPFPVQEHRCGRSVVSRGGCAGWQNWQHWPGILARAQASTKTCAVDKTSFFLETSSFNTAQKTGVPQCSPNQRLFQWQSQMEDHNSDSWQLFSDSSQPRNASPCSAPQITDSAPSTSNNSVSINSDCIILCHKKSWVRLHPTLLGTVTNPIVSWF